MGLPEIAAVTAITATAAGSVGGALAGGPPSNRLQFAGPEQDLQYLNDMDQQLSQLNTEITNTTALEEELITRNETQRAYLEGLLPREEAINKLAEQDQQIAERLGEKSFEIIGRGFLDEEDKKTTDQLEGIVAEEYRRSLSAEGQDYKDQVVERQITDRRRALEQGLAQRLGPGYATTEAGRRALEEFERNADELRYKSRQDNMNQITKRAAERVGLASGGYQTAAAIRLASRQESLSELVGMANIRQTTLRNEREAALVGSQAISNLDTNSFQAGMAGSERRAALLGEQRNIYTQMGQVDYHKEIKQAQEAGLIGPGSVFEQTGVSRNNMGDYKDRIRWAENMSSPYNESNLFNDRRRRLYPEKFSGPEYDPYRYLQTRGT